MIARNTEHLNHLVEEICGAGGEVRYAFTLDTQRSAEHVTYTQAAAFPILEYSYTATGDVFDKIISHAWPGGGSTELRVALWNVGVNVFGSFLDVTEKDIQSSLEVHVTAGFAFFRKVILAFKENELDSAGSRGTLLFTGATASIRGNVFTSAFAAGKHGIRALSQSLAKEFGKENIHVSASAAGNDARN